jgi:hypothetical protein
MICVLIQIELQVSGAMVFYYRSARSTHKMSFSKKSMFDINYGEAKM